MAKKTKDKYDRIANVYNFFTGVKDITEMSAWTKMIIDNIEGEDVLEIGVGTGKVAVHYPEDLNVIGIDFSKKMLEKARQEVKDKVNIKLLEMDAQKLDFDDNTFDTVVASCVFCAIPDPIKGIKEMIRVCKPDGKILMVEHVRSDKKIKGKVMDWLNVLTVKLMGEHINRDTEENLYKAGIKRSDVLVRFIFSDIVKFIQIRNKK